jgi:hypothetical protein
LTIVVTSSHVARRFKAGGGGHRIDGIIGCAVWAMSSNEAQTCAQLLRACFRAQQERASELLQVKQFGASRRCGAKRLNCGTDGRRWTGPPIH